MWAFEALRIARGEPRLGLDTDHRTIPNEAGWIGTAVHLDKGCYRGQETVARVHTLGRPPRRLTLLHLDGSPSRLPERGSDLLLGEKAVGFVGTSARHHELGPIALAMVKRNVSLDQELVVDGLAAAQEVRRRPRGRPARASHASMSWGLWVARILLGVYSVLLALALFSPSSEHQSSAVVHLGSLLTSLGVPLEIRDVPTARSGDERRDHRAGHVPGLALVGPSWSWRDWTAAGFLVAVAVELAQGLLLPGRQAAFSDIVANTAGALAGAVGGGTRRGARPSYAADQDRALVGRERSDHQAPRPHPEDRGRRDAAQRAPSRHRRADRLAAGDVAAPSP